MVLGGLNDLADDVPAADIASNIGRLVQLLLAPSASSASSASSTSSAGSAGCAGFEAVLVLTLPVYALDAHIDSYRQYKATVNQAIRDRVAAFNKAKSSSPVILLDIAQVKALNYMLMSAEEQRQLWDDDLHYSEVGYDTLARAVFASMKPLLLTTASASASASGQAKATAKTSSSGASSSGGSGGSGGTGNDKEAKPVAAGKVSDHEVGIDDAPLQAQADRVRACGYVLCY